jgi:hypothetical protein
VKKAFQSRTTEEEGGLEGPGEVVAVGSEEVAVVEEALRTRQREGVKKEDGVEVAGGGLAARAENFERATIRVLIEGKAAVDERLRFVEIVAGVKKGRARAVGAARGR